MTFCDTSVNCTFEEYQAVKRMNYSTLKHGITGSMLDLECAIQGGFDYETEKMRLGSLVHVLLLEPNEFREKFVVVPPFHLDEENQTAGGKPSKMKTTSYVKGRVKEFAAQHPGKKFVEQDQYDTALAMIEAIRSKPSAAMWYDHSEREQTFYGNIEGFDFKCRVDLVGRAIVDVKTTAHIKPFQFGSVFARMRYDVQLAIYQEIVGQNIGKELDCYIITVQDCRPFDVVVYQIPGLVLENGMDAVSKCLKRMKECNSSGIWPGYDKGEDYVDIHLPQWFLGVGDEGDWEQ